MALSIREQIIAEFRTRLARLVATGVCFRCKAYAEEEEFIAVWDGEEDAEPGAFNRTNYSLPLAVVWSLKYTSSDFPEKLNAMLADLIKEVTINGASAQDLTLGDLANTVFYTGSSMKYPADGGRFISVLAVFTVEYSTRRGDPFTQ